MKRRTRALAWLAVASLPAAALGQDAVVTVQPAEPVAEVDRRYLSFAIDLAVLVGGKWWAEDGGGTSAGKGTSDAEPVDLSDPRLRALTRALGPALLRVGGSEADFLYYDLEQRTGGHAPAGYETVLTAERWDQLCAFTQDLGLDLMFTLNAGPADRGEQRAWDPSHARTLLEHAQRSQQPVAVWELGNEVNAFWLFHGLRHKVGGKRYAQDYAQALALARAVSPGSRVAGPASAYWPLLGEPLPLLFGVTKGFLRHSRKRDAQVDLITWHYYPTQSSRCPLAVRRTTQKRMLRPRVLNEVRRWGTKINRQRDRYRPNAEVWLGETGPAQCGGEPGLSDTFASTFWWLDQLGTLAQLEHRVQVRQSLVGADYALIRADGTPNPDYWASLLWKRLMGEQALAVEVAGDRCVRAYAHRTAAAADAPTGSVTLLVLNLSDAPRRVQLEGLSARRASAFVVRGSALEGRDVFLNDAPLQLTPTGGVPRLEGRAAAYDGSLSLPAHSYQFVVVHHVAAGVARRVAEGE